MYQVLIVDDETIILSGIKFLIDWEANDCVISGTANNGKEALKQIETLSPDIVFCDIKMPVMDGIELLKIVNEQYPSIVFVLLTNLQDFSLVQEAMRYGAVDYILKTQINTETLSKCLESAKKECDKRSKLSQITSSEFLSKKRQEETIYHSLLEILFAPVQSENFKYASQILVSHQMTLNFGMLHISFDKLLNDELNWQKEFLFKFADTIFSKNYILVPTDSKRAFTLFCWNQDYNWKSKIQLFSRKFTTFSASVTQAASSVLATHCYTGEAQLSDCREEYLTLNEYYYLYGSSDTPFLTSYKPLDFVPLGLSGIGSQLAFEIGNKNSSNCAVLLDKTISCIEHTAHQRSQAIWVCNELNRYTGTALSKYGLELNEYHTIQNLVTRAQVISWINKLKTMILTTLDTTQVDTLELARQYVRSHLEDHISLQDIANYVNLSASYLSTLFKKRYNQTLIDYINQGKITLAQKLLQTTEQPIQDIAHNLGFENAYYFAKVFHKYTGCSPSSYRKTMELKETANESNDHWEVP